MGTAGLVGNKSKGNELCASFSLGFSLCMNKDSKTDMSVKYFLQPITLKSLIGTGTSHQKACSLIRMTGGGEVYLYGSSCQHVQKH